MRGALLFVLAILAGCAVSPVQDASFSLPAAQVIRSMPAPTVGGGEPCGGPGCAVYHRCGAGLKEK
jgi:hypothetical protein